MELLTQLNQLEFFNGAITHVALIPSGYTHQNYHVITSSAQYFVKYIQGQYISLPLLHQAAQYQLTPDVLFADENWLIQPFIKGKLLCDKTFNLKQQVLCSMKLMARCHQLSVDVPTLSIAQAVDNCLLGLSLSNQQQYEIDMIKQHFQQLIEPETTTLCHGDVRFANIIVNRRSWLVDFEQCCLAEPAYDIAMFVAINQLPVNQLGYYIHLYQQQASSKLIVDIKKVKHYVAFCYFLNGLWFYQQATLQQKPEFLAQAHHQFMLLTNQFTLPCSLLSLLDCSPHATNKLTDKINGSVQYG